MEELTVVALTTAMVDRRQGKELAKELCLAEVGFRQQLVGFTYVTPGRDSSQEGEPSQWRKRQTRWLELVL
jgi:hypothetical protein